MVVSEKNKKLMERTLDTINWDLVFKFYKLVGRTIGTESNQIPGIKKIEKGDKLTKENIKDEILCLVTYVMENDISHFVYGPWDITWINGEWEVEIDPQNIDPESEEPENNEEEGIFMPIGESLLEIHFSPLVVSAKEIVTEQKDIINRDKDGISRKDLENELDKAVAEENYELASRLRDVISIYKNKR